MSYGVMYGTFGESGLVGKLARRRWLNPKMVNFHRTFKDRDTAVFIRDTLFDTETQHKSVFEVPLKIN